jgi:hypothetical protein
MKFSATFIVAALAALTIANPVDVQTETERTDNSL